MEEGWGDVGVGDYVDMKKLDNWAYDGILK